MSATGEITSLNIIEFGNVDIMRSNISEIDVIQNRLTSNITLNADILPSNDDSFIIGNNDKRIGSLTSNVIVSDISTTNLHSFLDGSIVTGGIITPTTLASNVNDYNPTGLSTCSIIRLSASTPVNITGLQGGIDGRRITFENVGTFSITMLNQSASSSAENRFQLGGINANLVGGAIVNLIYDGIINRWRIGGATSGAATPGGLVQSKWAEVEQDVSTTVTTWPTPTTQIRLSTVLPIATIPVLSVTGFPASGKLRIINNSGLYQVVTYTSTTAGPAPTFNGCTGGTGTCPVNARIWLYPTDTTIAAGSNGLTLPQSTINVASTTSFPTSGQILIFTSGGPQRINYTGTTATTFTGCTGGSTTLATGNEIRNVTPNAQDLIRLELTSLGGALIIISSTSANATNNVVLFLQIIVDGFIIRGGGTSGNGAAPGGSVVIGLKLENVPAGDHTAVLRWRVSSGTGAIAPVTSAQFTNSNMLIQEVSS